MKRIPCVKCGKKQGSMVCWKCRKKVIEALKQGLTVDEIMAKYPVVVQESLEHVF